MIGAVLAGGRGSRLGRAVREGPGQARTGAMPFSKAATPLAGRPMVLYPLEVLAACCERTAVVCKADTELPDIGEAERWEEPGQPVHPLTGIVHALETAAAPVLVCAADMPFVTPDACRTLMQGAVGGAPAVVASAGGVLQPTLGLYAPAALDVLRAAEEDAPLTRTVEALDPARVALPPGLVRSVNTPEDLAEVEALMLPPR